MRVFDGIRIHAYTNIFLKVAGSMVILLEAIATLYISSIKGRRRMSIQFPLNILFRVNTYASNDHARVAPTKSKTNHRNGGFSLFCTTIKTTTHR